MSASADPPSTLPAAPLATAGQGLCVLELPPAVRASDAGLRASAARLLELDLVRSVLIDGRRTKAMIRLQSDRTAATSRAHLSARLSAALTAQVESLAAAQRPVISWTDPRTQTLCFIKLPTQVAGWRRQAFLGGAAMALLLGLLGVALPGLPTTPFVLLASYCLLRSSPKLHERLLHSRLFGGVLRDWYLFRGIRPHIRFRALMIITIVVAASLLLGNLSMIAMLVIAAIAACGIVYIWRLPSVVE